MNGIIAMVENAIFITPCSICECIYRWMMNSFDQRAPFINLPFGFLTGFTLPYQFQFILENHNLRYGFIQCKQTIKVFLFLIVPYVFSNNTPAIHTINFAITALYKYLCRTTIHISYMAFYPFMNCIASPFTGITNRLKSFIRSHIYDSFFFRHILTKNILDKKESMVLYLQKTS